MTLRLLEVYHPPTKKKDLIELFKDIPIIDIIQEQISNKDMFSKIIIPADKSEAVIDILNKKFSKYEKFRIIILSVEAALPRVENGEEKKKEEQKEKKEEEKSGICIDEIYEDVIEVVSISKTYFVFIILAAIVAAIGILYDNVAVVIGSMVIAPLLTPSIALSLATTIADVKLAKRAVITSFIGFLTAFIIGIIFGNIFSVDVNTPQIISRIDLNLIYVLLAFVAGIAGSLSFIKGIARPLVGVMVAVALLPPIVTSGLLFGSQHWIEGIGAFLLSSVNVVGVNLAGVVTFLAQGVSPKKWWEKEKAKRMTRRALILWIVLLLVLIFLIVIFEYLK